MTCWRRTGGFCALSHCLNNALHLLHLLLLFSKPDSSAQLYAYYDMCFISAAAWRWPPYSYVGILDGSGRTTSACPLRNLTSSAALPPSAVLRSSADKHSCFSFFPVCVRFRRATFMPSRRVPILAFRLLGMTWYRDTSVCVSCCRTRVCHRLPFSLCRPALLMQNGIPFWACRLRLFMKTGAACVPAFRCWR